MAELSDERIRNDGAEFHYYGLCSTQIYMQYRASIDRRLKVLMLEISKFYNETYSNDPETVNERLIEDYKAFWTAAEPPLQKFYEDIQNILALPKTLVQNPLTRPEDVYCEAEVSKIDKEIQCLEYRYLSEMYYLHALEQRKKEIEDKGIPLQDQIDLTAKLLKKNMRKMEHFDALNAKKVEKINKYMTGFDKKTLWESMCSGGKWEAKEKENMKNFLEVIEKN